MSVEGANYDGRAYDDAPEAVQAVERDYGARAMEVEEEESDDLASTVELDSEAWDDVEVHLYPRQGRGVEYEEESGSGDGRDREDFFGHSEPTAWNDRSDYMPSDVDPMVYIHHCGGHFGGREYRYSDISSKE